jgi:hypothetical protein
MSSDIVKYNFTTSVLQLLSGIFSGLTSRSAVAPFERIIVLKQTNNDLQYRGASASSST